MEYNLLDLYKVMKRIRMVEEAIADNYNNEVREMHTPIHLCDGQEAIAAGICLQLAQEDVIFSNHRCHGHYLAKGGDLNKMIAELHNKESGCCKGRGGSMHLMDKENGVALTSAIVAGNVSIGTGYALAEQMKKSSHIAVVFFGDGASEEGSVYESICFAKLKKLPILFVCENNLYAVATPMSSREPNSDISSKFETILPVVKIDGNDITAIWKAAKTAIDNARSGNGPSLLECMTYRFRAHHNITDGVDGHFRTAQELELWQEQDPIARLKSELLLYKLTDENALYKLEQGIKQEIDTAFEYARKSACPDSNKLFEGLWG